MSYEARRMLPPGGSRKRKEREEGSLYSANSKPSLAPPPAVAGAAETVMSNKVLAGYLAHEYLTKGTLLGKKFDPRRAMALSLSGDRRKSTKHNEEEAEVKVKAQEECYAEVANVVKSEGVHIKGIVNPTQLARWMQM